METVNNYFKNYSYEGVTEKSNGLVYRWEKKQLWTFKMQRKEGQDIHNVYLGFSRWLILKCIPDSVSVGWRHNRVDVELLVGVNNGFLKVLWN
jgi:hypothetical protein